MKMIIIAAEVPDGTDLEDVLQNTLESIADIDVADLHVVDASEVPASAYRIEGWS